ncbi:MAG: hypothetical protein ABIV13_01675 [Fimbriimonadales bacterium]
MSPKNWLSVTCGVILIAIFGPVGMCGLLMTASMGRPDPYGFDSVAIACLLVGALLVGIGVYLVRRR